MLAVDLLTIAGLLLTWGVHGPWLSILMVCNAFARIAFLIRAARVRP